MDAIKKLMLRWDISDEDKTLIEEAKTMENLLKIENTLCSKYNINAKLVMNIYKKICDLCYESDITNKTNQKNNKQNSGSFGSLDQTSTDYTEYPVDSNYGLSSGQRSSGYKSNGFILYKL